MGMGNIFYEVLRYFGQQMGISQIMEEGIAILAGAMLLLALLSCFFGYKFFRVWSAVMAFFLTAIGITALMSGVADRGVVVTTFAILGIMVGFLVYQWPKVSAFLLCGLIGAYAFMVAAFGGGFGSGGGYRSLFSASGDDIHRCLGRAGPGYRRPGASGVVPFALLAGCRRIPIGLRRHPRTIWHQPRD